MKNTSNLRYVYRKKEKLGTQISYKFQAIGVSKNRWHELEYSTQRSLIPDNQGVYVLYFWDRVKNEKHLQYIGSTLELRTRVRHHRHVLRLLLRQERQNYYLMIKFKITDKHQELERDLIHRLNPPCNKTFTDKPKKSHPKWNAYDFGV